MKPRLRRWMEWLMGGKHHLLNKQLFHFFMSREAAASFAKQTSFLHLFVSLRLHKRND